MTNGTQDKVVACKVSKFEDDVEDNRLLKKKQGMVLGSVQNWAIKAIQIECDEVVSEK